MVQQERPNTQKTTMIALFLGVALLAALPHAALAQDAGTVVRGLPETADCDEGTTFTVTLTATASATTSGYFVDEDPPAGTAISSISHGGELNEDQHRIKWVFMDGLNRQLSYDATVPAGTSEGTVLFFSGDYRFHPEMDDRADILSDTSVECAPPCPGGPDGTFHPYDAAQSGVLDDDDLFSLIDDWRLADGGELDDLLFAGIDAWKRSPDSYC